MPKDTGIRVTLGDDVKERIANDDLGILIELVAELIAEQRINQKLFRGK